MENSRRLRPDQIRIYRGLDAVSWKDGVSLGSDGNLFYRYLIVHDIKKAEALLPFTFNCDEFGNDMVIKVNEHREDMERHAVELGLEVAYMDYFIFWKELVILGVSEITSPKTSPKTSPETTSSEPPSYESLFKNAKDDFGPEKKEKR